MSETTIIGLDLVKQVFHLHRAAPDGTVLFRRRVPRSRLLNVLAVHPRAVVAMEACATAHDRGRRIEGLGHEVRLIPPVYVKPNARAPEERRRLRGGGVATHHAVRGDENPRAAGAGDDAPWRDLLVRQRTQLIKRPAGPSGGVRHSRAAGACSGRAPGPGDRG